MVEAVITNFEIPEREGKKMIVRNFFWNILIFAEEELEPLDSPPPSPIILCVEWIVLKMCGSCYNSKEDALQDGRRDSQY